ncbi:MAG TPA: alpha/beta hydrolase, partial [Aquabacterium sp.]|nr:alpha/beta hydrolase [Aquabacterium sp.]
RWIASLSPIPLMLIHGTSDQVIPYQQGEALFALAKEPKTFISVPNGEHTQAFAPKFRGVYQQQVLHWLDQILPR